MQKILFAPKAMIVFLLSVLTVFAGVATPVIANAVTVKYEIEGSWAEDVPSVVKAGDILSSTWWYNINDSEPAPENPPHENVTVTFNAQNAKFTQVPDVCETSDVDPVSVIQDNGSTLVCNLGTRDLGTAEFMLTGVQVDGSSGDKVSLSASVGEPGVNEVSAALPELEIYNDFAMDMKFDGGAPGTSISGNNQKLMFPWSLRHAPNADDGPDSVTYTLRFSGQLGETIVPTAPFCSPQSRAMADYPYSDSGRPADRTAPYVDNCTLTQISPNAFQLTLSGIDYSKDLVPSRDSSGNALPSDWDVVAAGMIHVQFQFDGQSTISFTADPVTYTSVAGEFSADLEHNNSNSRAVTRGVWIGGWTFPQMGEPRPPGTIWTDTSRTMAGQRVLAVSGVQPPTGSQTQTQVCAILDTKFVTFESAVMGDISNGVVTPYPGVTYEYFTGNAHGGILNPNHANYDPNEFRCDGSNSNASGWQSGIPSDLSTVRVIRATVPASANVPSDGAARMHVYSTVKEDVQPGQDIWHWTSYHNNNRWWEPHRTNNLSDKPGSGTATPGSRYAYTGGGRDVMRIVAGTPHISKDVDSTTTRQGANLNYTLTYRVDTPVETTVSGVKITDTLPAGLTYVPGSASVVPTSVSGQTLTWELDEIEANTDYTILLDATVGDNVSAGQAITNLAQIELGELQKTDTAHVRVRDAGYTFLTKTAEARQVPHDNGSAQGSWTVRITSADTGNQSYTDTIDILPFNDDGRGTDFSGTYTLDGPVQAVSGATVYYTTADPATLADDPADPTNGAAGDVTGNTVGWTTTFTEGATAVRVIGPELAAGANQAFTINVVTEGATSEDMYVNRAESRADRTRLVMRTSDWFQIAAANSVTLKKYVQDADGEWHDAQDVDDYPKYHNGSTVPYRIVVTNTGDQTLNNLVLQDDRFDLTTLDPIPEGLVQDSDNLVIQTLEPGDTNALTLEYEMEIAGHDGGEHIVNNACVIPEDEDVDEACDPAGIIILPSSLAWEKVSASDPAEHLTGSEWELVPVDEQHNPTGTAMTITDRDAANDAEYTGLDQNAEAGKFLITELSDGLYRLTETKAPAGYVLDSEPRYIIVEGVTSFDDPIINEQQEVPTLPLTGGVGTTSVLTAAGIAGGLALLLIAARRKRPRNN